MAAIVHPEGRLIKRNHLHMNSWGKGVWDYLTVILETVTDILYIYLEHMSM